MKTFCLFLTDDVHRVPLGTIEADSFMAAAKQAAVAYAGTLRGLVLPRWRIESTEGDATAVAGLRRTRRAKP